jgi:hypothetical protein
MENSPTQKSESEYDPEELDHMVDFDIAYRKKKMSEYNLIIFAILACVLVTLISPAIYYYIAIKVSPDNLISQLAIQSLVMCILFGIVYGIFLGRFHPAFMSPGLTLKDFVKMLKKNRNEQLKELYQLRNKNTKKILIIIGVILSLFVIGSGVGSIVYGKVANNISFLLVMFVIVSIVILLIPASRVYYYLMLYYIRPYEDYTEEKAKKLISKMSGGRKKQTKLYKSINKKHKKIYKNNI